MDDGTERVCADFFVDFHVWEEELFRYSVGPSVGMEYGRGPMDGEWTATMGEVAERLVREAHVSREAVEGSRLMVAMVSE